MTDVVPSSSRVKTAYPRSFGIGIGWAPSYCRCLIGRSGLSLGWPTRNITLRQSQASQKIPEAVVTLSWDVIFAA